jgi:hypothetical protein
MMLLVLFNIMPTHNILSKDNPIDTLVQYKSLTDLTGLLTSSFIRDYGEKKAEEIGFDDIVFSPTSRFIAVTIRNIRSGDPEQAWIIDLKDSCVQRATDLLKDDGGIHVIYSIFWLSNDTLLVYADNGHVFQSTISGYRYERTKEYTFPRNKNYLSSSKKYELTFPKPGVSNLKILSNNMTMSYTDKKAGWQKIERITWSPLDKYFVFQFGMGSGGCSLFLGAISPKFKIIKLADDVCYKEYAVSNNSQETVYPQGQSIIIQSLDNLKIIKSIHIDGWPHRFALSSLNEVAFSINGKLFLIVF